MLFTDESCLCVDHADGRFRVYRRTGERYVAGQMGWSKHYGMGRHRIW